MTVHHEVNSSRSERRKEKAKERVHGMGTLDPQKALSSCLSTICEH